MLRKFKGRTVEHNQKVACFWNLHEDVFSVEGQTFERGKRRKLILAHGNAIMLKNVKFTVNERLRQQVLAVKQKNIHAFVKGELQKNFSLAIFKYQDITYGMREAYYNPYKQDCFTDKETGEKLESAEMVILKDKKVYYIK